MVNSLIPYGKKSSYIHIHKPAAKNLQVCLSAYELLLPSGIKVLMHSKIYRLWNEHEEFLVTLWSEENFFIKMDLSKLNTLTPGVH